MKSLAEARVKRARAVELAAEGRSYDEIARLAASFNDMAGALQRQIDQLEELSAHQRRFRPQLLFRDRSLP